MSIGVIVAQVERDGFVLLPGVFTAAQADAMLVGLGPALSDPPAAQGTMRSETGTIYAARNLLTLWPAVVQVWRQPPLLEALAAVLGPEYGLVRVLYFDKPPERSWALPWHKDMTIAVRRHLPSVHFSKPTRKASVPHVEAPTELLEQMLTARIHLDEVTEENGPLKVLPGSHRTGKVMVPGESKPRAILASRGDVLLMRPLLAHNSGNSHPQTKRHRRILHLEFAGRRELADGYAWHDFLTG
jgi:hypothetical protein